jgi:hypothetical protein
LISIPPWNHPSYPTPYYSVNSIKNGSFDPANRVRQNHGGQIDAGISQPKINVMARNLPLFRSYHKYRNFKSATVELISQLYHLEDRLNNPIDQSIYFRWARNNYWRDYYWMADLYNNLAEDFNRHSNNELLEQLDDQRKQFRLIVPNVKPFSERDILRQSILARVKQYEDYLQIKAVTSFLPSWKILKTDNDLLSKLLKINVTSHPTIIADEINQITQSHNRIAKLIISTLEFEYKLSHPEDQLEYLPWAMRNNEMYHIWSTCDYDSLKEEFNGMTVDDLVFEIGDTESVLRDKIPSVTPLFARAFMRSACISRINKYNDYLQVKSITDELPSWEDLKSDHDLLTAILNTD